MKKQCTAVAGFSLPELMIAMAVLGILCGISLVNLSQQLAKERLLAASRATHSWLDTQRRIAMTDATACEIEIDTAKATLKPGGATIQLRDNNNEPAGTIPNACSNQSPLEIQKTVDNGSGIALSITPANASAIRFSMRGLSEIITSDGKASQLEMKLNQTGVLRQRCIKVISPLALIRTGSAPPNSQTCAYSNSF